MSILRSSNWSYKTGATGGASIEFVVASGGTIVLADPGGRETDFYYGGVGVGLGLGLRVPKIKLPRFSLPEIRIPKIAGREVGGAGSVKSFDSAGLVFMTPAFRGAELAEADFQGGTVYLDGGLGIGYGKAGSVMLLGINSAQLALGLSSPAMTWLAENAIAHAPAVLLMGGTTIGLQAGAGAGILVGYLH
ncbi:hypothetical protein WL30_22325 [Burkholderia ubonensis]|uniref:hypothetical protein n=1 Tax=Burkholderia ubonensis TaxID=101571 RepID=UPI000752559C|nr:hypothetical protein [Burkholderia ubonensis]KVN94144.1 hypothetical protein WJ71_03790 [Burkholderia ubonensis]KVO14662.1 hypothetical protein WJ74_12700 [Burkholderia ubonensis]KVO28583.1 hypothetical protein WJ76_26680 [Burkholderia ubonensis]KVP15729.1 hypothetical protein WJ85_12850 [Burkholderia ubonensis]KVQ67350.1 hypothetical protein WK05_01145 [Burkholderia ubonensis]